jgi:hypothetical protein
MPDLSACDPQDRPGLGARDDRPDPDLVARLCRLANRVTVTGRTEAVR